MAVLVIARLRTTQITQLQQVIAVIKRVQADVSMKFFTWGVVVYAVDVEGVCILHFEIKKADLQAGCSGIFQTGTSGICQTGTSDSNTYECPKDVAIGVSNGELMLALNTGKAHDTVTLEVVRGGSPDMVLRVRITNDKGRNSFHDVNVMDMDDVEMQFPRFDNVLSNVISINSLCMYNTCKHIMATRGRFLVMFCSKENFFIQSVGDTGKASMNVPISAPDITLFEANDVVDTPFRAKVISMFLRAYRITNDVTIHLTPNMPVKMVYKIPTLGTFSLYVSPEADGISKAHRAAYMSMFFVCNEKIEAASSDPAAETASNSSSNSTSNSASNSASNSVSPPAKKRAKN